MELANRFRRGWNAFMNRDPTGGFNYSGSSSGWRPDRPRFSGGTAKSVATSIYNRIALDASSVNIQHCRVDKNDRFVETLDSGLNRCLTFSANIDQTGRAFIQDCVMSMLDEGCVALVPVDTDTDPDISGSFSIYTMRTGKIVEWLPDKVRILLYNDRTGKHEEIVTSKNTVAIVENPLYAVINEPNSTMKRLVRKLSLLDSTDERTASGKMDLIIQLPYAAKSQLKKQMAEQRLKSIEDQLMHSMYGIAYIDGTERVTQLNRPVENNLLKQIEYLTNQLFSQLGLTQSILDGTADEKTMLNYYTRTIEPIVAAISDELSRKFLSPTARTQRQTIRYFRNPFKLVPVNDIAELADKFTRNEIMTSNEIRQIIGMKPSNDPKADQLVNSNISQAKTTGSNKTENTIKEEENQNG